MRGRFPIPTHLKVIAGNPGRRPLEDVRALPPASRPECPAHLGVGARAEWDRIVPELETAGLLQRTDRAQLAAYCIVFARWVETELKIAEMQQSGVMNGLLVKSPNGYPQISPLLVISNKCMDQIRGFGQEFGLSPAARVRVRAMSAAGQGVLFADDPMEAVLRAGQHVASAA